MRRRCELNYLNATLCYGEELGIINNITLEAGNLYGSIISHSKIDIPDKKKFSQGMWGREGSYIICIHGVISRMYGEQLLIILEGF